MENYNDNFTVDDMIFSLDGNNNITGGGFSVNSFMMKKGISPIITLNTGSTSKLNNLNNVSNIFDNLAIPNWVISYNEGIRVRDRYNRDYYEEDDVITDNLYNKLLDLVKPIQHDEEQKQIKEYDDEPIQHNKEQKQIKEYAENFKNKKKVLKTRRRNIKVPLHITQHSKTKKHIKLVPTNHN
jgi:hypothetical protein